MSNAGDHDENRPQFDRVRIGVDHVGGQPERDHDDPAADDGEMDRSKTLHHDIDSDADEQRTR